MKNKLFSVFSIILILVSCTVAKAQQRPVVGPFNVISSGPTGPSPFSVQSSPGQTAPVLQTTDSSGTVTSSISPEGVLSAKISVSLTAKPKQFLFADTNNLITGSSALTYDPLTQQVNVFPLQDASQARLNVFSPSLFNNPLSIVPQGYGSFTVGNTMVDMNTWNRSTARIAAALSNSTNYESALVIHTLNDAPVIKNGCNGGTVDCSWTALHETEAVTIFAQDRGVYWSGIPGGPVGIDVRAGVLNGAVYAGAFAGYYEADLALGTAGHNDGLVGMEIGTNDYNSNNDEPEVGQYDTKLGLQLVDNEGANPHNSPATAALFMNRQVGDGTSGFHKGLLAYKNLFFGDTKNDGFVYLGNGNPPGGGGVSTPLFWVRRTGQTLIGDFQNFTNTSTYPSSLYGQLAVRQFMTVVEDNGTPTGTTNNKRILGLLSDGGTSKMRIISGNTDTSVNAWPLTLETGIAGSTSTNEVLKLTNDPFVQFTSSYSGGNVSAAGTVALRNNSGTLEASQNGGAWAALSTSGSGFWTRAADPQGNGREDLYPSTSLNDRVLAGISSSDLTDQGVVISNNCLYAVSGSSAASVGALCYVAGGPVVTLASGISPGGTYRPLTFTVNNAEIARFPIAGNFLVGMTSTDITDTTDVITPGCLDAVSGTTAATVGSLCYISGDTAVALSSGISPGGTYRPLEFKVNNSTAALFDLNGNLNIGTTASFFTSVPLHLSGSTNVAGFDSTNASNFLWMSAASTIIGKVFASYGGGAGVNRIGFNGFTGGSEIRMSESNTFGLYTFDLALHESAVPGAGANYSFYVNSSDHKLYVIGPSGTVTLIAVP